MKISRTMKLEKLAASSGGDRYEEQVELGDVKYIGKMYVLQPFSRPNGVPIKEFTITISSDA